MLSPLAMMIFKFFDLGCRVETTDNDDMSNNFFLKSIILCLMSLSASRRQVQKALEPSILLAKVASF